MPKQRRLSRSDFSAFSTRGARRLHGRLFALTIAPLPHGPLRCAVVVSKKVSLRAVDRNRIKRRGRAVLQSLTTGRPEPLALSFLAKREALKATFQEVEKDVRELFERAGLRDTMRTT